MANDIDEKPQTEKVVVERESSSSVWTVIAVVVVLLLVLWAVFASGMFGGTQETSTPDIEVNTPTESTPTIPTPNEGQ